MSPCPACPLEPRPQNQTSVLAGGSDASRARGLWGASELLEAGLSLLCFVDLDDMLREDPLGEDSLSSMEADWERRWKEEEDGEEEREV